MLIKVSRAGRFFLKVAILNQYIRGMFQANFKKWPPTVITDNIFGSFMMAHKKFPYGPICISNSIRRRAIWNLSARGLIVIARAQRGQLNSARGPINFI